MVSHAVTPLGSCCPICGHSLATGQQFYFDEAERLMVVGQEAYRLMPKAAALFGLLLKRLGNAVSRDAVLDILYAGQVDDEPYARSLDTWICYLRPVLEESPYRIETVYRFGWRLVRRAPATSGSEAT